MSEPEKHVVIGINTPVERPEGWTAGQGGNLTFTVSTLAADLARAEARIAALEAEVEEVAARALLRMHADGERIAELEAANAALIDGAFEDNAHYRALEAAANAVLAQSVFVYGTAGDPWCAQCGRSLSADVHSDTCGLGALAALLEELPTEEERAAWAAELALSKEIP